jgi:4-hydroxy-3-methylbut-2-enyl diphosphate reductase IspH
LINKNEFDKIFTLGELIHNKIYTDSLEKKGVKAVDISEISEILNSSKKKTEKVKTDAEDSSKISPAEGLF